MAEVAGYIASDDESVPQSRAISKSAEIILHAACGSIENQIMAIKPGALLAATTASGAVVHMRAISAPVRGHDFPVVWVCTEQEYETAKAAETDHADMKGIPWPLDAVHELAIDETSEPVPPPRTPVPPDASSAVGGRVEAAFTR